MSKEGSVAPKERVNITYKPAIGNAKEEVELPLKMLMLGDYTQRSDPRPLEDRKPINIDKDNFQEVLAEQKLTLDLSVAENVFLGQQPTNRLGFVQWRRMAREAGEQLKRLGLDVDPRSRLGDLPIGLQQLIEIARVLFSGARIIILDEPTSALSPPEVERLFTTLRQLRDAGTGIVFISHFIEDILRVSDTVTVFRNGRKVAETTAASTTKGALIEAMILGARCNLAVIGEADAKIGGDGEIKACLDRHVVFGKRRAQDRKCGAVGECERPCRRQAAIGAPPSNRTVGREESAAEVEARAAPEANG